MIPGHALARTAALLALFTLTPHAFAPAQGPAGGQKPPPAAGPGAKPGPAAKPGPGARLQNPPGGAAGQAGAKPAGKPAATPGANAPQATRPPAPKTQVLGDPGEPFGTVYAQAGAVVRSDFVLHEDEVGGCDQDLLDLQGGPGGFAAVWHDLRNGNLGLYLGFLDARGEPAGQQVPVNEPRTSRQFEPALALASAGRGAVAWYATTFASAGVALRPFSAERGMQGAQIPVSEVPAGQAQAARANPAAQPGASPRPALALSEQGAGALAWSEQGRVRLMPMRDFRPTGGEAQTLNAEGPPANGELALALSPQGDLLVAWDSPNGIAGCSVRRGEAPARVELGAGRIARVLHAGAPGGWWLAVHGQGRNLLRRLGPAVRVVGPDLDPFEGPSTDFSITRLTPAGVLAIGGRKTGAEGEPRAAYELRLLAPNGTPALPQPLRVPDSERASVGSPLLASSGGTLLVAWTDRRAQDTDIYYRTVSTGALGPERRWNSDHASAAQNSPDVDSNGERAVIVWQDHRSGSAEVRARVLAADGSNASAEFAVAPAPAERADAPRAAPGARAAPTVGQIQPSVAVNADGRFLVCWAELGPQGASLRARAFSAAAQPLGPALVVDPGQTVGPFVGSDAVALRNNRGYVLTWIREDLGPASVRISLAGQLEGAPRQVGALPVGVARNPSLALLADDSLIAAWDVLGPNRTTKLGASFLAADGRPQGQPLEFEASPGGGDHDPSVAASPEGGFLLSWVANDGPERDVWARLYDRQGKPLAPALWISARSNEQDYPDAIALREGGYLVAFECDLSGRDHCAVRRVAADGRSAGPARTLNQRLSSYVEDRTAPRLAPLGAGFVGVWNDLRRGRGMDVFARVSGPDFDRAPPAER